MIANLLVLSFIYECFTYLWMYTSHLVLVQCGLANSLLHVTSVTTTLRARQNGGISQTTFSNSFFRMKNDEFRLRSDWSLFQRSELFLEIVLYQTTNIFIHGNAFCNVECKMAAIVSHDLTKMKHRKHHQILCTKILSLFYWSNIFMLLSIVFIYNTGPYFVIRTTLICMTKVVIWSRSAV